MKMCCFGHKTIFTNVESANEILHFKKSLKDMIEPQIINYDVRVFMTGGHGEFDNIFADTIRKLKITYPYIQLILVEPYYSKRYSSYKHYYESLYDNIIILDKFADDGDQIAIENRNCWMAQNSDFVITYINNRSGNEYTAMKYAKKINKFIFNLGEI